MRLEMGVLMEKKNRIFVISGRRVYDGRRGKTIGFERRQRRFVDNNLENRLIYSQKMYL